MAVGRPSIGSNQVNQLNHGEHATRASIEESLAKLGTSYVDLVLIHTPAGGKLVETWCTLKKLRHEVGTDRSSVGCSQSIENSEKEYF